MRDLQPSLFILRMPGGRMPKYASFLFALLVTVPVFGGQPTVSLVLEQPLEGYELMRWLPADERIVVRHHGELVVVHEGDCLPESDVTLTEIGTDRIVFEQGRMAGAEGAAARSSHESVVIISRTSEGRLQQMTLSSKPPAQQVTFALHPEATAGAAASSAGEGEPDGVAVESDPEPNNLRD